MSFDFIARGVASAALNKAAPVLSNASSTIASIAEGASTVIPATVQNLMVSSNAASGDFGGARYRRVGAQPFHQGRFQSADGALWELAEPVLTPQMFGAKGDGVADDTTAIRNAILACALAASGSTKFKELYFPAGTYRTTSNIIANNPYTSVSFNIRGAGRNESVILADFFTTTAVPSITLSGGGGTGALLVPVIDSGVLTGILICNAGTGYATAPTATLVDPAGTGSGASITIAVSGGAITTATISAGGSGYTPVHAGDALTIKGFRTVIQNLSVSASAARTAATNGGTSVYPYGTINNGISFVPAGALIQTVQHNALINVTSNGHPGHGVSAARQEQMLGNQLHCSTNGADGFFMHTQQFVTNAQGIANSLIGLRTNNNGYRGTNVNNTVSSTFISPVSFGNLTAGSLPAGVAEANLINACTACTFVSVDWELPTGSSAASIDVCRMSGSFSCSVSGFLYGGRYGVHLSSVRAPVLGPIYHFGYPADVSSASVFYGGGVGDTADRAPVLSGVYNAGNVNLTVLQAASNPYSLGFERGILRYCGLQGSQYAVSVTTTMTPDFIANGSDQVITLGGNTAFVNPTRNGNAARLTLTLVQDATGGRAPTFGTAYVGVGALGSGTANQIGVLELQCVVAGARTVWVRKAWSGWL